MSDDPGYPGPPGAGGGGSSFLDWHLDQRSDSGRTMVLSRAPADDGAMVITVAGEVDLVTAPDLRAAIDDCMASGITRVVLDVRELAFIDSTGLAVLVGATKRLRQRDGDLTLVAPSDLVRRALEVTGLDRFITVDGPD